MNQQVMLWAGAGQIGMAIARRMGYGKKILVGDKKLENAQTIADGNGPVQPGIYPKDDCTGAGDG